MNTKSINQDSTTNTIKLAPGIGGLTFANSLTYNKIKQQTTAKSTPGSPMSVSGNIAIVKRERESSPLQNISPMNGNKLVARNSFTPKSIAIAAHAMRAVSPAQSISMSPSSSHSSSSNSSLGTSPSNSANHIFTTSFVNNNHNNNNTNNNNNNNNSGFQNINGINVKTLQQKVKVLPAESEFPKPAYSYSCLIAMALKNSRSGSLPVSEIYSFMCEHFPYFKTAPSGWKNSVRHNLSLNKCFEKIEKPATNGSQRKGCLWAMNPDRIAKMDDEVLKWSRKDPKAIRKAMVHPENLEALERGEMKHGSTGDSDMELDSQSEIEEASDLEEHEVDDLLIDNCVVEDVGEEENEFGLDGTMDDNNSESDQLTNDQQVLVNELVESMKTPNMKQIRSASRDFDTEVEDIYDAIDMEDDKNIINMKVNEDDIIEIGTADLELNALTRTPKQQLQQQQQRQQQQQQQFIQQRQPQQNSPTVVVSVADFQTSKRARLSYSVQHQQQQQQQQQQIAQSALQRQQFLNKQQLLQLQQQMKQQQVVQQVNSSTLPLKKVKVFQQISKPQHSVVRTLSNTTPTLSFVTGNNNHNNNNMNFRNNSGFLQFSTLQQPQQMQQHQQRRKMQIVNRIV